METTIEHTLSDVLRKPKPVLREAERRDILIRRRQASDMILMGAGRARALRDVLGTLSRLLQTIADVAGVTGRLIDDVNVALPWTSLLPPEERGQFVNELMQMASAAAETGDYTPITMLLRDWKATALVYADPAAFKELTEPLEEAELPTLLTERAGPGHSKPPSASTTVSRPTRVARIAASAAPVQKRASTALPSGTSRKTSANTKSTKNPA